MTIFVSMAWGCWLLAAHRSLFNYRWQTRSTVILTRRNVSVLFTANIPLVEYRNPVLDQIADWMNEFVGCLICDLVVCMKQIRRASCSRLQVLLFLIIAYYKECHWAVRVVDPLKWDACIAAICWMLLGRRSIDSSRSLMLITEAAGFSSCNIEAGETVSTVGYTGP